MSTNRPSSSVRSSRTNSLAIAAFVCGVVEFAVPPACVAAIILGHMGRRQIRQTGEAGHGLATAGVVLGYLFLALMLAVALIGLVAFSSGPP